jgi:alpha-glucoside transport system permease protein
MSSADITSLGTALATEGATGTRVPQTYRESRKPKKGIVATLVATTIAILWTIPTVGLLITSFRPQIDALRSGWWEAFNEPNFTLDNYRAVLSSGSEGIGQSFINSIVVTVPAVILPLVLASLAAYGFAWIDFRGRPALFVGVFALQIVPLQVALIPLLTDYVSFGLGGTFWPIWISHSIFALPLAVYLLNNFMREIPRELVEAARVDGAGHVKIFFQVLMPLLTPAIAAFGIFQFLWVWNDLLVGLTFGSTDTKPITVVVADLVGTRGSAWHLLSAGAFVSIALPVIVFVSLQRFFVRGLLAGGLKG